MEDIETLKDELRNMLKNCILALNANDFRSCKKFISDLNFHVNKLP